MLRSRRFLRARKFDYAKSKEMLLNAEQWRKDFGVDDIIQYVDRGASGWRGRLLTRRAATLTSRRRWR